MPERFEIKKSANNQFHFVLVAPNNKPITTSEIYKTKDACKNRIESVKKYAKTTPTEDKTL